MAQLECLKQVLRLDSESYHKISDISYSDSEAKGLVYIATNESDDEESYIAVEFTADIRIEIQSGEIWGGYTFSHPQADITFVYQPDIKITELVGVDASDITDEVLDEIREIICDFVYSQAVEAPNHYKNYPASW